MSSKIHSNIPSALTSKFTLHLQSSTDTSCPVPETTSAAVPIPCSSLASHNREPSTSSVNDNPLVSSLDSGTSTSPTVDVTHPLFITPLVKRETAKAEVIWALDCVRKHRSARSCNDQGKIFANMFPDSQVAQNFHMAEVKLAYVTTFGLAPHFQKETVHRLGSAAEFSISFDEALNKVIQKGQLDVWVRYYSITTGLTCSEYLSSIFLGHSKSENLLSGVIAALEDIGHSTDSDLSKLLQISMDGPNVNLRFYTEFLQMYESQFEKKLVQTGVCSLHVLSGALQHGLKQTNWNLPSICEECTIYSKTPRLAALIA